MGAISNQIAKGTTHCDTKVAQLQLDAIATSTKKKRKLYETNQTHEHTPPNSSSTVARVTDHPDSRRNTRILREKSLNQMTTRSSTMSGMGTRKRRRDEIPSIVCDSNSQIRSDLRNKSQEKMRLFSPFDVATAQMIRQHVQDVRREVFLRPMIMIVSRLMFHRLNHGLFNVRVDPVAWNIPHYLEVVKHPMDLSLIKNKCLNLEYESPEQCAQDIRLVFENACLFNPPGHAVHEAAELMMKEFEAEYLKFNSRQETQAKKKKEHTCASCLANVCGICNEKCINFEPPLIMCTGPCKQKIKRHAVYYITINRMWAWCAKCYTTLPRMIITPYGPEEGNQISKQELVKTKCIDELTEPWVQCDTCEGWVHQVCALFNTCENEEDQQPEELPYTCPLCKLKELEAVEEQPVISSAELSPIETSVEDFPLRLHRRKLDLMGSHSPVVKKKTMPKEFTRALGFDGSLSDLKTDFFATDNECDLLRESLSSRHLRSTPLSCFMQTWIRNHLVDLGEEEVAGSMSVKVVSSFKNSFSASSSVREQFKSSNQEYPESIEYSSKAIFVFQQINNVEVCIFSMYVQEYDENANVPSNRLRTYIAYIDSLVYMRPRYVRTSLFQEVLISYLAFCKRKGFLHAHIWACPTTRGGDFIYWCHPSFQKNPGKDRLLQWYMGMAEKAKKEGVVYACKDMYSNQFQHLESTLEQTLPTYFDGDYWISECNRFAAHPPKRGKLSKEAYEESLRGPKFRKRVIDAVNANKDALFEISLQPICFKCEESIVNSTFWCNIENGNGKENDQLFLCSSCFENDTKHKKDFKKIAPPSFVRILPSAEEKKLDNTEISCSFLDHRADLLKNCEMYHYQFDSFRRAKYSTMMLIYQIYSTQVVKQSKNESTR